MADGGAERALVTGGGGFLGKALVRRLVSRGLPVTTFSRKWYPELHGLGVRQIRGDIAESAAVTRALEGQDLVFHAAALAGVWGNPALFYRVNTLGTRNVIDACRKNGVGRLVYTSSPSVVFHGSDMEGADETMPYPDRFEADYPRTKALAEQAVRAAGIKGRRGGLLTIALRPHLIWGPGDNHLVPRILARAGRLRQVGDGGNRVDTIYIDNAVDAHLLAAESLGKNPALSGNVYFISQGAPVRLWEMVNHILAAGGLGPVKKKISAAAAYHLGGMLEALYRALPLKGEPPMTRFVARELATSHWFDIGAARRDLGYRPRVGLEEGLERLAGSLKKERR